MLQDDLKEIARLARMGTPTDITIRIAKLAESAMAENLPWWEKQEPEVKLESIQIVTPEPESPPDLESIRIKLQTDEKVELPSMPVSTLPPRDPELDAALKAHDDAVIEVMAKETDAKMKELLGDGVDLYDPSMPLEIVTGDNTPDFDGGIVAPYTPPEMINGIPVIKPPEMDPRDV